MRREKGGDRQTGEKELPPSPSLPDPCFSRFGDFCVTSRPNCYSYERKRRTSVVRGKYLRFPALLACDFSAALRAARPIWSQIMRYFGNQCGNITDISIVRGRGFAKSKISSQLFIVGYNDIGVGGLFIHHPNIAVCNTYRGQGWRAMAPREVIYLTFAAPKKSNHGAPRPLAGRHTSISSGLSETLNVTFPTCTILSSILGI